VCERKTVKIVNANHAVITRGAGTGEQEKMGWAVGHAQLPTLEILAVV